jgi:rSAM/selenodomain-associated transferase 1
VVLPGTPGEEILIFAKYPEAGRCKTRLAAGMGEANALAVYKALLGHTLNAARPTPARKILFVDPPGRVRDACEWAPGMDLYLGQSQGDLGDRLCRAMQARFDAGAGKLLLIGCDCPQISKESLCGAFRDLEERDVVLGPTEDGGYYLLGLKRPLPILFRDVPWSTDKVLEITLNILKNHSLSYLLRDTFFDVDTLEDFQRVRRLEPLGNLGIG